MRTRRRYPVVAMCAQVVLPGGVIRFGLSRSRTAAAVEEAMVRDGLIFLVVQENPKALDPGMSGTYRYGTLYQICSLTRAPRDTQRAMLFGIRCCSVEQLVLEGNIYEAESYNAPLREIEKDSKEKEAMFRALKGYLQLYAREDKAFAEKYLPWLISQTGLMQLLRDSSSQLSWAWGMGRRLLKCSTGDEFYEVLTGELSREVDVMRMRHEYEQKLRVRLDRSQREFMSREQLRVIEEEFGEDAGTADDVKAYAEKTDALPTGDEVKQVLRRETLRLRHLPQGTQESALQQNYLDMALTLPFGRVTEDTANLTAAKRVLERGHYGLETVKEKILNCLVVRKLNPTASQNVLCLVGPPGAGRTSIAESIARTPRRRYMRISLGGIQDEAELRGHRRTYVGAMPGRIAEAFRHAGSKNPLVLLDEIDKLSKDYRGQAATAALLEMFDSSQNRSYRDHCVELPTDLSQVFFLATANTTEGIPAPLMDRVNLIYLSSYTEAEKFHIARRYLLPRARRNAGLTAEQFSLTDGVVRTLIRCYTREAGVCGVEWEFRTLTEKCVRQLPLKKREHFAITAGNLEDYFGRAHLPTKRSHRRNEVSVAHGLAYTVAGGVALSVEVEVNVDRGFFRPTGQMDAVMRESAELALVVVRQLVVERGTPSGYFREHDFHLRIPAGAIPKDGLSAGAAIALALLSAFRHQTVHADLAVTGEITLRGHILPAGGLKEELLTARRERFTVPALPYENRTEITALPKEVTAGLKLYYIREFRELVALALTGRGEEIDGEESDNSTPLSGGCLRERVAEREEGEGEEEGN